MTIFPLGHKQKPDDRDRNFPLSALMAAAPQVGTPVSKVWKPGPVTDQTTTNGCVGHATYKLLTSEPILAQPGILSPELIYAEARDNDEWEETGSETDGGTSVRAGLEVLRRHGLAKAYFWAESGDECMEYLLKYGPLVLGIPWFSDMFEPDGNGIIRPGGIEEGGHAILCYAAQLQWDLFTLRNSWTENWGKGGDCMISRTDLTQLLANGGVAAAVLEK